MRASLPQDRETCLATGQRCCYDSAGNELPCTGSGQDAEFQRGLPWPVPRFELRDTVVADRLTGLLWSRDANPAEFPLTWVEALDFIKQMNREKALGFSDWRLPNRHELRSLMSHHTRKPALPEAHPFENLFLGWYWSSTSAALSPAHAWYLHLEGARLFYGGKDQSFLAWPVRGSGTVLPATGQTVCYDAAGREIACAGSGQDGESRTGVPWPDPRFTVRDSMAIDRLTGLAWHLTADLAGTMTSWEEALAAVADLNRRDGKRRWRLPNINELESLVDCGTYAPALPRQHPFQPVRDSYWSSTTSAFEPDWAWALYLDKGAVGVGQKRGAHFYVWPVSDPCV